MSVSLKKPEKVDLSKSESPRKLPEYTPIHLIDEEETIVNRPSMSVCSDVRLQSLIGKLQSDEIAPDSTPKDVVEIQPHIRKRIVIGIILAAVVVLAILFIWLNFPSDFFQDLAKSFEESQDIYALLSVIASNPIVILLLAVSSVGIFIYTLRKVFGTFTRP